MKLTPLAALFCLTTTLPAFAIENGTPLNWAQHDNLVEMRCTGTVVGGRYVLTADHCKWESAGGLRGVNLANGTQIDTLQQISPTIPPSDPAYFDISLWKLATHPDVTAFTPLSLVKANIGDQLDILGFGSTQQKLFQATKEIDYISITDIIYGTKDIGKGTLIGGDSGGPTLHNGTLIATSSSAISGSSNHVKLAYPPARDFILNTVNGWHYPTLATTSNGTATITIQSLHNGTGMIDLSNILSTTGDVTLDTTAITCQSQAPDAMGLLPLATSNDVKPFDVCSLPITSNGDEGKIVLGNDAVITVNKKAEVKPDPKPQPNNGGGGGGGGSLGWAALFGLLLAGFVRRTR